MSPRASKSAQRHRSARTALLNTRLRSLTDRRARERTRQLGSRRGRSDRPHTIEGLHTAPTGPISEPASA